MNENKGPKTYLCSGSFVKYEGIIVPLTGKKFETSTLYFLTS